MRLDDEESVNVDDLRGDGGGGFGGFGMPVAMGGGGLGLIVLIVLGLIFGVNPAQLLGGGSDAGGSPSPAGYQGPAADYPGQDATSQGATARGPEDAGLKFVRQVTALTEDTWSQIFQAHGRTYQPPRVTLYSGGHQTGCGFGQAAMGPFYCPADHRVWLDLAFFDELATRFGAPGQFAEAYVIAHEVGHHVQTLLGTTAKVDRARQAVSSRAEANQLSVRIELQADCYAGVWAAVTDQTKRFLDPGDVEEGLRAAAAVGDDTLQRETQGQVVPDSFTHGSSAQRMRWFRAGFDQGRMEACDTFSPDDGSL